MSNKNKEIWKSLTGLKGIYEVSNLGRIKSLDRIIYNQEFPRKIKGKILKATKGLTGYYKVNLSFGTRKNRKTINVHQLVANTFLPNIHNLPQINHKDGNKANNKVSNLEWCTAKQNTKHAYDLGLKPIGQDSHCAKLTNRDVKHIRKKLKFFKKGMVANLAKLYNVHTCVITAIKNNRTWRHV